MDYVNIPGTGRDTAGEGEGENARMIPEIAVAAAAAARTGGTPLLADANGVIVLPAGATLDDIAVVGRDLVVTLANGQVFVIPDGAIFVPQLVIDGVAVPPLNLAALLIGDQTIEPAAGLLNSSGNNFFENAGPIQTAFPIGDLLPPTEFGFAVEPDREVIPQPLDRDPTVVIVTPNQPVGVTDAIATVAESGLPTRNAEPAGSNAAATSETATGTIVFNSPDGVASMTINGVLFTGPGQSFASPRGVLTITSFDPAAGTANFTYTLTDNLVGGTVADQFAVVLTDPDGDVATSTLTINVTDDAPIARNDTDAVPASTFTEQTGNVITGTDTTSGAAGADTLGADNASITRIASNAIPANADTSFDAAGNLQVAGQYGTLLIKADGSYSYTRAAGTPGGVSDVFTYTLTDTDDSPSTATLTIAIANATPAITSLPIAGSAATIVAESGLPVRTGETPGSNATASSEITSGTITFAGGDGPVSATINGVPVAENAVVTTPSGTLLVTDFNPATGTINYIFTLADNTAGDTTSVTFNLVVTDVDGDPAPGAFTIAIVDDAPTALADADSVSEDGATVATGNVITALDVTTNPDANTVEGVADTQGADGAVVETIVYQGTTFNPGTIPATYGSLQIAADGSYRYTLNNANPLVQGLDGNDTLTETFTYTIRDGDGDPSTTTLTITIQGADDGVPILGLNIEGGEERVLEANLADGSAPATAALTQAGTFSVTGVDGIATIVIDGVTVFGPGAVTLPGTTFNAAFGTLTIISVTPVTDAAGDTVSATIAYSYTLNDNTLTHTGATNAQLTDSFAVTVTDSDGSTASDSLDVVVVDDAPTARADADSVSEDGATVATGNVITALDVTTNPDANTVEGVADTQGADGAVVETIVYQGTTFNPGTIPATYGSLQIAADGSYRYTLNNANPLVQGLDGNDTLTETFTYTIRDGDGDPSTTTLTITIQGADDGVPILGLNIEGGEERVLEANLADGSAPATAALTQAGTFSVTGVDGIATIVIDGVTVFGPGAVTLPGTTFNAAFGTLTIISVTPVTDAAGDTVSATIAYSYTLNDNTLTHTGATNAQLTDSFAVTVTDSDGSTASDSLDVVVVDDAPTARADGTFSVAEQTPLVIDALANDTFGADGVILATGVAVTTQPTKGTVSYDATTGQFTYTPNAGAEGPDSFQYTITDRDGDPSTATVTLNLLDDSVPVVKSTTDLAVDEDGFANANGDATPLQGNPAETDGNENLTDISGVAVVNFGADTPANLLGAIVLQTTGLNGQLKTLTGADVTFGLESGVLVGRSGDTEVIRIAITGATAGLNGDVTYTYSTTLAQPVMHATAGTEDLATLLNVSFQLTDSDGDMLATPGRFDVTVRDDVPSLNVVKGDDAGVVLTTQDAETDGDPTSSDVAVTTANFSGVFSLSSSGGADGAANTPALSYALAVTGAASGLASHGEAISLVRLGDGTVVGYTGTVVPTLESAASVVFSVKVSASGVVTLTQYQQIDHPLADDPEASDAPFADQLASLADGLITLTASSSITDNDGDSASDSETINIGANIRFADDGPVLSDVTATGTVTIDETAATANFAISPITAVSGAAVIAASSAFGADGAGATVYGLTISGGGTTPLKTAIGDFAISLVQAQPGANTITGQYTDTATNTVKTAFTLVIGSDGKLTVTQFVALEHLDDGTTAAAYDDALTLTGLVNATITITDFDGDTASASRAIGANITFKDDGPTLNVVKGDDAGVVLTTQDAETDGDPTSSDVAVTTANFSGVFSLGSSGGADGAANTPALSYALAVTGAASGLASHGEAISLVRLGDGTVVGYTGTVVPTLESAASVVFSVKVSASGVVTLTQYQQIDHPLADDPEASDAPFADQLASLADGLITLTASSSITDNDGDSASDSETINIGANIRFADDGPVLSDVTATGTVTIDETAATANFAISPITAVSGAAVIAASSAFGADGAGATVYGLTISGGGTTPLKTAIGDFAISLVQAQPGANTITGQYTDTATNTVKTAFTLVIGSDGKLTVTQFVALEHLDDGTTAAAYDDALTLTGLVNATITITDFDGDTASASRAIGANITFKDDGPTLNVVKGDDAGVVLTTQDAETDGDPTSSDVAVTTANFSGVFSLGSSGGADGAANTPALSYALAVTGAASGLASHGEAISLVRLGDGTVVGYTGTVVPTLESAASVVFSVKVSASGVVTLTQYQQIDHPLADDPEASDAPFADQLASLADGLITLTASSSITDNDGDSASDSETINIGANIRFADDGPVLSDVTATGTVTIDETAATANFAISPITAVSGAAVIAASSAFGADGAGATVYGLTISGGGTTPLKTAIGDFAISLVQAQPGANTITGQYTDTATNTVKTAFTLVIGSDGKLTVTQFVALEHLDDGTTAAAYDDALTLTGLVNATITITDFDGDTASASRAIGANITFEDDGVDAVLDTGMVPAGSSAAIMGNVLGNDERGADGSAISGIVNTAANTTGTLDAGVFTIAGQFGSLTVNATTGAYTYTRTAGAGGGSNEVFTYTLTDNDDDSDTATLTIAIGDLLPVAGTASATVDDEGLTGGIAGVLANGDIDANAGDAGSNTSEAIFQGTLGGTLGDGTNTFLFGSGLTGTTEMIGQETVTYTVSADGSVLTAAITGGSTRSGTLFTVEITAPATGAYTLTLVKPVLHATLDGLTDDNTENDVDITIAYQLRDQDQDLSTTGALSIKFDDDSPAAFSSPPTSATGVNVGGTTGTFALNLPGIGADSPGSASFAVNTASPPQAFDTSGKALTFNGQTLFYTLKPGDSSVLEARTSTTPGEGTLVFSIDLNAGTNSYVYTQFEQLSTTQLVPITNLSTVGGGNVAAKAIDVPNSALDLLLTTAPGFTVNTNSSEIGVGQGNSVDTTEVIRFDFIQNVSVAGSGGNAVLSYGEYYSANSYRQDISGVGNDNGTGGPQRADFTVRAYTVVEAPGSQLGDPADGDAVFQGDTNDTTVTDTTLKLYNSTGGLVDPANYLSLGITVTSSGGVFTVSGLPNGYDFEISSTTFFQAVEIAAVSGTDSFKLGVIGINVLQVQGSSFSVPIDYTDADGDSVSSTITVNLSAPMTPVVLDLDGDGVEFAALSAGTTFDYAGDGSPEATAWAGTDDGILALDLNANGSVDDGSEIVFGGGGLSDLEGLAAQHDSNHDGTLDANDADFAKFGVWQDADGDGTGDAGEFSTLNELGITSIALESDGQAYSAAGGDVTVAGSSTYTRADGSTGTVADATFATAPLDKIAAKTAELAAANVAAAGVLAAAAAAVTALPAPTDEPAPATADASDAPVELSFQALPETHQELRPASDRLGSEPVRQAPAETASHDDEAPAAAANLADPADRAVAASASEAVAEPGAAFASASVGHGFAGDAGQLMEALLAAAQAASAGVGADGQQPQDLAAVQEAFGDSHAAALVDAVVAHFAGAETAVAGGGADALATLLAAAVGGGEGFGPGFDLNQLLSDMSAHAAAQV